MKEISSKSNAKIKEVSKLFCSSKRRSQSGLFVVEGLRLCIDAYKSGIKICCVYLTEKCFDKSGDKLNEIINSTEDAYIVSEEIFKHISDTVNPQGVLCVCEFMQNKLEINDNSKLVVLSEISDPSNLGAVCRTAEALGLDGIVVCGGCDIYNPKALRASMGALFRLPVAELGENELFEFLTANNIKTFASTPREAAENIITVNFKGKCAMFIGNEANGLNDEFIEECDKIVKIPMIGRAESLNAAAAASVLMYEMMREEMSEL